MRNVSVGDKNILRELVRLVVFKVLLPYLRHLIDQIRDAPDPTEALKWQLHRNRLPASVVTALLGGTVGIGVGAQVAVASMGFWSGLGYSLGLVSVPLWGPVAGGVMGAAVVGGAAYAALTALRPRTTAGASSLEVVTAASVMIPPEVWVGTEQLLDAFLSVDFGASARQRRKDILARGVDVAAAAASISATVSGQPELLAVVAEGYALARAALADSESGEREARTRALTLATRLGVEQQALDLLLDVVDRQLGYITKRP